MQSMMLSPLYRHMRGGDSSAECNHADEHAIYARRYAVTIVVSRDVRLSACVCFSCSSGLRCVSDVLVKGAWLFRRIYAYEYIGIIMKDMRVLCTIL